MTERETLQYLMAGRVADFGAARTNVFPPQSVAGKLFGIVTDDRDRLREYATSQTQGHGTAREGGGSRTVAREAVRDDLIAIKRTARILGLDTPGLDGKFQLPRRIGEQGLLTTARAFADDAAPLKDKFIAHGLPADFLEDLEADAAELEAAISEHDSGRGAHVAARAQIEATLEQLVDAVRRLDVVVTNTLRGDAGELAHWHTARHWYPKRRPEPAALQPEALVESSTSAV